MNLIEVTASLVLVTILLLVSLQSTTGLVRGQASTLTQIQAERYADSLLDEMASVPYALRSSDRASATPAETTPLTARSGMLELSDYDNYFQTPPRRTDGTVPAGMSGWSVSVSVQAVDPTDPDTVIATPVGEIPTDLSRLTVTLTSPQGNTVTKQRLLSRCQRGNGLSGTPTSFGQIQWTRSNGSVHHSGGVLVDLPGS